jgi:hypothetical protein
MGLKAALLLLALLLAGTAAACPTCKDSFGNAAQSEGLAAGFYYSILFMLGVVFSLVGGLIFKIVREARKGPGAPQA